MGGTLAMDRLIGGAMRVNAHTPTILPAGIEHAVSNADALASRGRGSQPQPAAGVWLRLDQVIKALEEV